MIMVPRERLTRTQVQLTKGQHHALRERAHREKKSLSAAVREAVDLWLAGADRAAVVERSLTAIGKFRSGRKDISRRHDAHLAEIYGKAPGPRR